MRKIIKSRLVVLVTIAAVVVSLMASPAVAATGSKMAELFYRDILITLNGVEVTPKDADGNVMEPFIIDGTTYLPVRGVSSMLGLDVDWDGAANTVKLSSETSLYYIMRVGEMYDEFFALFNNMYWVLEQMNHLNDRMWYEEDTSSFEEIQSSLGGWIENGGDIDGIIRDAGAILSDIKSYDAPEDERVWFITEIEYGEELLSLSEDIHAILLEMHAQNRQCYISDNAFDAFMDNYYDALDMLYDLDSISREGQLATNEYLRNSIY